MDYTPEQLAFADALCAQIAKQPKRTQNLILALFEAAQKGENHEHE